MGKRKKVTETPTTGSFLVRLPTTHRAVLKRLTTKNRRSVTTEVQIALEKHYRDEGVTPTNQDEH